ncbi:WhiB family transcriptional regulator (plasmid) [Streptomyces sp. Q6]|uniref:WhiB family transcriptional regulator n=1 Tax=Streptomyces citrinus TaxID=3118173 RepID=A0ACD5AQU5_9ACTN
MRAAPRPLLVDWDWQQHAACRGMNSSAFFSPSGERGRARRTREERARRVCAGCEVRTVCAATALKHGETYGVWGGLSRDDRRRLDDAAARTITRHEAPSQ